MRIVGLDLALSGAHKAMGLDRQTNRFVTQVLTVHTWADELADLLRRARVGAGEGEPVAVVMEPTGLAWLPVAIYLKRQPGVTTYRVASQQVADLRRYLKKHAKSDRIDCRVLARLPMVDADKLNPLCLSSADLMTLQRGCKLVDWLVGQITALKNQLIALDGFVWLGGWKDTVFEDPFGPAAGWCRREYYDPRRVVQVGAETIRQAWRMSETAGKDTGEWATTLVELAHKVLDVFGDPCPQLDLAAVHVEVTARQTWLERLEADLDHWRTEVVRPLYRRLHPSRNLETLHGVGQDSAAVYLSFLGDPHRFPNSGALRGWSGLVPRSSQSAGTEAKGLHISQAGPDLVKKFAYLDAEVARLGDPQLAKVYYDQMVHYGKHHTQAVIAVAAHLLDRVLVILQDDRPYELRDVDGSSVTSELARDIIARQYTVPDEVRRRNTRQARRARADAQAEQQHERQDKPRGEGRPLSKRRTG